MRTCWPIRRSPSRSPASPELVDEGRVGAVAPSHFSVMGYQQAGLEVWRSETAPAIVERLRDEGTDGLILAPV